MSPFRTLLLLLLPTSLVAIGGGCGNAGSDVAQRRAEPVAIGRVASTPGAASGETPRREALMSEAVLELVIGPELGTDEPIVSPALNQEVSGIASNGTDYLAVFWGLSHGIHATRISAQGQILDPLGIEVWAGPMKAVTPSVTWTGSDYLVVWEQIDETQTPADRNIRGARVSSAGEVLDEDGFDIATEALDQRAPKVVGGGGVALAVWIDGPVSGGGLSARRISGSGTLLDAAPISLADTAAESTAFDLAHSGSRFLVAWERRVDPPGHPAIDARMVNEDGTLDAVFTVQPNDAAQPAIGSDGSQFLVAWQDRGAPNRVKIHASRVSMNGEIMDAEGFAVWPAQNGQLHPRVAFAAGHFYVTWNVDDEFVDGGDFDEDTSWVDLGLDDVYAVRVTTTGSPVGEARAVASAAYQERYPNIASTDDQVLIAWTADLERQARGARLDCCGNVLDPNGLVLTTGPNEQHSPSVAYNGDVYLAVWLDHRDEASTPEFDVWGVRFSQSGQVLDPNGIKIADANVDRSNVDGYPRVASLGSSFFVVWPEPNGGHADIRAARVTAEGGVIDSGTLVGPDYEAQGRPALASNGDRVLIVWEFVNGGETDLAGLFVTPAAFGAPFNVVTGFGEQSRPAVASDGDDFLVAWEDSSSILDRHVLATRVTSSGTVLDGAGFVVSSAEGSKRDPAVAWGGGSYLVAWTEESAVGLSAARVSAGGRTLEPNGFPVVTFPEYGYRPQVAWLDSRFLVVWDGGGIRGATVTPSGSVEEGPLSLDDTAKALKLGVAAGTGARGLVVYDDHAQRTPRVWARLAELGGASDGGAAGDTGGPPGMAGAGAGGMDPAVGGASGEAGADGHGGTSDAAGAGAAGDAAAAGDAGLGAGGNAGAGNAAGKAGGSGTAGAQGDGGDDVDDPGCGCRVPSGGGGGVPALSLATFAAIALARLRRRRRTVGLS
jgi:hypothetical protein